MPLPLVYFSDRTKRVFYNLIVNQRDSLTMTHAAVGPFVLDRTQNSVFTFERVLNISIDKNDFRDADSQNKLILFNDCHTRHSNYVKQI